jgi:hypothetical protein
MDAEHASDDPLAEQGWDREREANLQRQHDVYAAARATVARHHLRDVRKLALRGQYSYHDVRRARRDYLRAKAVAPSVWLWGPDQDTRKAA